MFGLVHQGIHRTQTNASYPDLLNNLSLHALT